MIMKKTLLTLLLLVATGSLFASPITLEQARQRALRLSPALCHSMADVRHVTLDESGVKGRTPLSTVAEPAYYLFNTGENDGFLILSGDDQLPAVLGYSDHGSLHGDFSTFPPALQDFLDSYSQYVDDVRAGRVAPVRRAHGVSTGTPIVGPLVTAQWDQAAPYNIYCPTSTYVGCVATAFAQVLYYYKWPESGTGTITYTNSHRTETVDFSQSKYDWASMKDVYSYADRNNDSGKAVAKLSYDCGVATHMDYGTGGSGTHSEYILAALHQNFRYRASTIEYRRRDCCASSLEFLNYIKADLDLGRPVIFSAASTTGGGRDAAGHCFVCDGYDSVNYLHINWGWSGECDGWYDIDVMDADHYTFNDDQSVILGIVPDRDGSDTKPAQLRIWQNDVLPSASNATVTLGQEFKVQTGSMSYPYTIGYRFDIAMALYDASGNFYEVISTPETLAMKAMDDYIYGFNSSEARCKLSGSYKTGNYLIRTVFRQEGYSQWQLPLTTGGSELNAIKVYIHDGVAEINKHAALPDNELQILTSGAGYATFYDADWAYTLPSGLSASIVTGVQSNGKLIYKEIATGGSVENVIPKGVPVVLMGADHSRKSYTLTKVESTKSNTDENLLHGTNVDAFTQLSGSYAYYKLTYGAAGSASSAIFGWYWGAPNGAAFTIEAHRVWLAIPTGSAAKARFYALPGNDEGIQTVETVAETTTQQADVWYDLTGRRVTTPVRGSLYIRNGRKILVK